VIPNLPPAAALLSVMIGADENLVPLPGTVKSSNLTPLGVKADKVLGIIAYLDCPPRFRNRGYDRRVLLGRTTSEIRI